MALLIIGGSTISPDPSEYSVDVEDIVEGNRNGNGDLIADLISRKRKISLTWFNLTDSQWSTIVSLVRPSGTIFFSVTYHDSLTGTTRSGTFYASKPTAKVFKYNSSTNQIERWENCRFNIIEK